MLIAAIRANLQAMQKEIDELMRLDRRIADVRGRIDESEQSDCRFPGSWERIKIRELLSQTLKDLEARKVALGRANPAEAELAE